MEDESPLSGNNEDSGLYEESLSLNTSIQDQAQHNRISSGISWYKASFLIINAALGAGLLNFPKAFSETGGIIPGNVIHFMFTTLSLVSLILLALAAREKDCKTYQEVVKRFCNERWSILCSVCIALYCFVTCITFIIIIGDQFDRAFASFFGTKFCLRWYLNRNFTMIISSLFLIYPCCLKRIDEMKVMSYVGVVAIVYLVVVITLEMAIGNYPKGQVDVLDIDVLTVFKVVPTICFGYQCHVSSVPILSCLKKRDKSGITKACAFAVGFCFLVYSLAANCGYLTFGNLVNSDIFLDYEARKGYILFAVLLLAIKSWTTYPILFFCVREAIGDIYISWRGMNSTEANRAEPRRRKVIATILWITSIMIAVFIPGINSVVKLLGCLAGLFILVFPGMCYMLLIFERQDICGSIMRAKQWTKIVLACSLITIGMFAFGLAFTLGIQEFLRAESDKPICVSPIF